MFVSMCECEHVSGQICRGQRKDVGSLTLLELCLQMFVSCPGVDAGNH